MLTQQWQVIGDHDADIAYIVGLEEEGRPRMVATTAWGLGPAIQGVYRSPFRGEKGGWVWGYQSIVSVLSRVFRSVVILIQFHFCEL